jgi:hypothetical protein
LFDVDVPRLMLEDILRDPSEDRAAIGRRGLNNQRDLWDANRKSLSTLPHSTEPASRPGLRGVRPQSGNLGPLPSSSRPRRTGLDSTGNYN